jgi:hypothetical protein
VSRCQLSQQREQVVGSRNSGRAVQLNDCFRVGSPSLKSQRNAHVRTPIPNTFAKLSSLGQAHTSSSVQVRLTVIRSEDIIRVVERRLTLRHEVTASHSLKGSAIAPERSHSLSLQFHFYTGQGILNLKQIPPHAPKCKTRFRNVLTT